VKKHLIAAIGLFLAMTSFLVAQTATGVIRETVQDVTGAVLIHVHVMLVDEATNQIRQQATNEQGLFEFRTLPFGNYRVEVEHPGAGMVNAAGFMTLPPLSRFRNIGCGECKLVREFHFNPEFSNPSVAKRPGTVEP
jgi:hypothetical protein